MLGDLEASLSAMGLSAVDIDGDGVDEVFVINIDVCPQMFGWMPKCYVSLGVSVAIGVLYALMQRCAQRQPMDQKAYQADSRV